MNKLQEELLDTYKKLAKILNENNIKFVAIGGTAIGAFREEGFIPWDDDIDIAIHEDDYIKFIEVMKKNNSPLKLRTKLNGQNFLFAKVFDSEKLIYSCDANSNLYIDVFILFKKRKNVEKAYNKNHFMLDLFLMKERSFKYFSKRNGWFSALWIKLFSLILVYPRSVDMLAFKRIKKLEIIDDGKVYLYSDFFKINNYHTHKYDMNGIINKKFEDTIMPVSSAFPEDAKTVFGDIFTPPKIDGQINHETVYIGAKK